MVMYENESKFDPESEEEYAEIPFHKNKNPPKILFLFVAENSEDIYVLVQSCHLSNYEQDSIIFQWWSKEYVQ